MTGTWVEGLDRMNGSRPTLVVVDDEPNVLGSLHDQFRAPYPGESGQRNNFRGPGYFGIDLGLGGGVLESKTCTLGVPVPKVSKRGGHSSVDMAGSF